MSKRLLQHIKEGKTTLFAVLLMPSLYQLPPSLRVLLDMFHNYRATNLLRFSQMLKSRHLYNGYCNFAKLDSQYLQGCLQK